MPADEPEPLGGLDLAPPPSFGVADRTDKHMLPVATAMEDILDDELDELVALGTDSGAQPSESVEVDRPSPTSVPSVEAPAAATMEDPPESQSGGRRLAMVGLLLAGAGMAAWFSLDRGATPSADAAEKTPPSKPEVTAHADDEDRASAPPIAAEDGSNKELDALLAHANDVAQMKSSSYTARHSLLEALEREGATDEVDLDLHIALDLMQASQSASPCTTFADALTLIESAPDRPSIRPALASVETVPAKGRREPATACDGLQQRLDALRPGTETTQVDEPDDPEPEPKKVRPRRSRGAARPAAPRPSTASEVPAAQPKAPPTPPKKASVVSKLNDGLRE